MSNTTQSFKKHWIGFVTTMVAIASILVFLAMILVDYKDGTDECRALGGQTWDYGDHCIIGDYEVVDTNN